MNDLII